MKELIFDVLEAWYLWLSHHHCGIVKRPYSSEDGFLPVEQHSDWWMSYNRLSTVFHRMQFKPSPMLSLDSLTERSREIYDNLCMRGGFCDCQPLQLEDQDGESGDRDGRQGTQEEVQETP